MTKTGTALAARRSAGESGGRVDWVDYAKGICIVMVVMMHSVLGVEKATDQTGFMHLVVAFARPFRMPDFFMISGLFLPLVIDRDWRTYLDRKVVHFAYFYTLWLTIQFAFKVPVFAAQSSWPHAGFLYLESFIDPFGTLWFIYLLAIFFVVIKLTRNVSPLLIWSAAALLETLHVATGWTAIDEFCARFVYIYSGYLYADRIFALSNRARAYPLCALAALALWALIDAGLVATGYSDLPVVSLILGLGGACAIVTIGTLLAHARWLDGLRFCGEHSLVIYLSFFLPMAASRTVLLKVGLIQNIGLLSLVVTIIGVLGALLIWRLALAVHANFLFERPDAFWIAPKKRIGALQAAE